MSEEPLFDPSLKKRKKKTVAFTEDPLGAEADPTAPAPTSIDSVTADGEAVDLGPKTAHEQMQQQNGGAGADEEETKKDEDDMFADMKKKKKKKKDIPMDFVSHYRLFDLIRDFDRCISLTYPSDGGRFWHVYADCRTYRFRRP